MADQGGSGNGAGANADKAQAQGGTSKTEASSYYFFKSTPQELQRQYAPVPLKPGQKLDFTPRVTTLHQSTLVKKDNERKALEAAAQKGASQGASARDGSDLTFAQIRKNPYDFRDKKSEEEEAKEPESYEKDQKVVITGLVKAAKYNGSVATILGAETSGRYPVKIDETSKQLNVKRGNLKMYRPVVCTEFTDISMTEGFRCTPDLLFRALTDAETVSKYQRADAKIECKQGGKFSLFGGSIVGEFTRVNPPSGFAQKWRFREWPDGCYSSVDLSISSPEYGVTVATLKQTGIPLHDKFHNRDVPAKVKKGWKDFFWGRIQKVMGYSKVAKSVYKKKKEKKSGEAEDDADN